jgi:hypothetical protein
MERVTPATRFPELETIVRDYSPHLFSPLEGELLRGPVSDYFAAWDGGLAGFLTSRIGHPFFTVEGGDLVGWIDFFDAAFEDPVAIESLAVLAGGAVEDLLLLRDRQGRWSVVGQGNEEGGGHCGSEDWWLIAEYRIKWAEAGVPVVEITEEGGWRERFVEGDTGPRAPETATRRDGVQERNSGWVRRRAARKTYAVREMNSRIPIIVLVYSIGRWA